MASRCARGIGSPERGCRAVRMSDCAAGGLASECRTLRGLRHAGKRGQPCIDRRSVPKRMPRTDLDHLLLEVCQHSAVSRYCNQLYLLLLLLFLLRGHDGHTRLPFRATVPALSTGTIWGEVRGARSHVREFPHLSRLRLQPLLRRNGLNHHNSLDGSIDIHLRLSLPAITPKYR